MTTWDATTDFLVIGSGGGALVGALRASALGKEVIVSEKSDKIGGSARSRSFEAKAYDAEKLGALKDRLRPAIAGPLVMYTGEAPQVSTMRTVRGLKVSARVGFRTTVARLRGKKYLTWWIPGWKKPDGSTSMAIGERSKPGSIIVDSQGNRYFNEAVAYQEAGQRMFAREAATGGAIPSWLIIDSWHRTHYTFGWFPPGKTPQEWIDKGLLKRSNTLEDLARKCGIDLGGLASTVERFNGFARTGVDEDFHRGEGDHEKFQGDPSHKPNASLGPIARAPFYAIALYPGDLGTNGGLLTDEFGRVLDASGQPIAGLYAAGNCTASVMGRKYLGAGATIGPSTVFGYVAAGHSAAMTKTGVASAAPEAKAVPSCPE